MTTDTLRAFLRAGLLVAGCGVFLAFINPPQSPEFVVSVCSTLIGLALIGGVLALARLTR